MAENYEIALELAKYRYKAAMDTLREIRITLGYMSAFHIKTMTGTSFTLGEPDIATGMVVGVPNTAEAVVLIKASLDKLRKIYYPVFKKELKPLAPSEINKYKCFSAADLFKSTELVSALNKCYASMASTAAKLNEAASQTNAAAADTSNKQMASAALTSPVPTADRILDKQTSDKTIAEAYKEKSATDVEEQTKKLNDAISEKEEFPFNNLTQQNWGSRQLSFFGLTPRIPNSVADTVTEFSMWLLSKQYPKGMKYCNDNRTQGSTSRIRRDQTVTTSGGQSTHLNSLGSSASTAQTGAEFTSSTAYIEEFNRVKASLEELRTIMNNTDLPQDRVQSLTSRLVALDLSMRNSDDVQAQKDYMTLIRGLGQEIDALKTTYGPGYRAKQESLAKALSASRAATQSRSPTPVFRGRS